MCLFDVALDSAFFAALLWAFFLSAFPDTPLETLLPTTRGPTTCGQPGGPPSTAFSTAAVKQAWLCLPGTEWHEQAPVKMMMQLRRGGRKALDTVLSASFRSRSSAALLQRQRLGARPIASRGPAACSVLPAAPRQSPIPATSPVVGVRFAGGAATEFAFSMTNASKVLPGGRVLLDNCSLSFYQGAKIGIIGPNGAGKSSFLKLIAGADKEFEGDVWISDSVQLGCVACAPGFYSSSQ